MPSRSRNSFYCALLAVIALGLCVPISLKAPNADIWNIHIWNGPSPPAEGRLPSYHEEDGTESELLAIDLGAAAASYVLFVIFICILLLTVGRRLRRATQASPGTLAMEILQPVQIQPATTNLWGPSPISPAKSSTNWPSPRPQNGLGSTHKHESAQSEATFDESVISEDRAKNEIEMDRLWGAVAEHESQRDPRSYSQSLASEPQKSPMATQYPPELQHLRYGHPPPPPQEPTSPTSARYPVNQQAEISQPPSRTSTKSPRRLHKPSPITTSNAPSRTSSRSSFASWAGRKKSPSIRDLPISPPMGSPDFRPNAYKYDESSPLTPQFPQHNPQPSAAAHREAFGSVDLEGGRRFHFAPSIRSSRSDYSPAPTPRTATFPVSPPPAIREQPSREEASRAGFNFVLEAPSERSNSPSVSGMSTRTKPKPLTLDNTDSGSASTSKLSLALRTAPLPFRALRSPNSKRPPSMIKATEVERPEKKSNFLRTPGTAMPHTPYSPYMPQTPLTPMTPSRLVTREERKRTKKEEGRRVLTQDDIVPEEDTLWGDAY